MLICKVNSNWLKEGRIPLVSRTPIIVLIYHRMWNHDNDHVHILFKAHPNVEMSKFIDVHKSVSTRLIKREYPDMKKQICKEYFWPRNYYLLTTHIHPMKHLDEKWDVCTTEKCMSLNSNSMLSKSILLLRTEKWFFP